jgi:FkbM family methyltransferase
MLMRQASVLRMNVRSLLRRIFYLFLDQLGIRRLREHSFLIFFYGSRRWSRTLARIVENSSSHSPLSIRSPGRFSLRADPALAESLKQAFGDEADVVHAAAVAESKQGPVTFTRSIEPESSSIFKEWSAAHGIADQMTVPTLDFSDAVERLGKRIDLIKMDVEGAEIEILESASAPVAAS